MKNYFDMKGHVAIVTGCSGGLGVQMAKALANQGCNIVPIARRMEKLEEVAKELREEYGVEVLPIRCDVTNTEMCDDVVRQTMERFGRIDILINNAGTGAVAPAEDITDEQFDNEMQIDLFGTFRMARAVAKQAMIPAKYGRIINIASMYGLVGNKIAPCSPYHAAKGGVVNLSRGLAAEWGKYGITVNTICPGYFYTPLTEETLRQYDDKGYTGFLVNLDETSVGVLYDIRLISDFCTRNHIFLVVDSISSFLCDEFDMKALHVQVMITGSQKALACPPGVALVVLSEEAVERVNNNRPRTMYFDLKSALKNQERGQTPFTCAVGILLQINRRLREIDAAGGVDSEVQRIGNLAKYFRERISGLPLQIISDSLPNAVTPLTPTGGVSAFDIFTTLKNEYGIWVCPNGGELRDKVFRVGHIGALTENDFDTLIEAFHDMHRLGLL